MPSSSHQTTADDKTSATGLSWLEPLWSARDPRTRFAGLSIASLASRCKRGCLLLTNGFNHYQGGIWRAVSSFCKNLATIYLNFL